MILLKILYLLNLNRLRRSKFGKIALGKAIDRLSILEDIGQEEQKNLKCSTYEKIEELIKLESI